ncbi:AAA family ATPase [Mesorhizobium jarvisii]|uniref:AAA family ATPase n=1 Tax=Mesorhizobium jarvisii TaxID=1777867 RepID=UPI001F0AE4CA|nr:AAA family ATPase [Mesorhizobium jarvisii]MCH4561085.1 ATP-binding protein [Mesorhizobium jarvisii]
MRISKARITNYRSVKDSGWFDVEIAKTILVGPNEAGKTALLRALQQINAPADVPKLDPLRDYPRSAYNDITTGKVDPAKTPVAVAQFALDDEDKASIDGEFVTGDYVFQRNLDNGFAHYIVNAKACPKYTDVKKDLVRLAAHVDGRIGTTAGTDSLRAVMEPLSHETFVFGKGAEALRAWLESQLAHIDEANIDEEKRYDALLEAFTFWDRYQAALTSLRSRLPVIVLFSNYFRVRPLIHLDHLASRIEGNLLDDDQYDYGNKCLLNLLGFSARELSNLGKAEQPAATDADGLRGYRDQLDKRSYQLNAASVRLTNEIKRVWNPNPARAEADRLRVTADGQYLKVVVEDDLGVEIELDQRSEGFQWLVSFFIVFFSETNGAHKNAILLLDEPGLSLHALKQRDFRETVSRLAADNQTIYSTHSPFLVGPDELDIVRVVEMTDRKIGTKVHSTVTADDPAALLPLQEALGYDLAQSLFAQQRNLILEGLTDLWYLEATADLLRAAGVVDLNQKIALIPANKASKVVYYATILHAHSLKVAALLDSDAAGDQAAKQDVLVSTLGAKRILRTKDIYTGEVATPEIEDVLRETLIAVAESALGWDVKSKAKSQRSRPIIDIFASEISEFSKYKLSKAYVRWTRDNEASALGADELAMWKKLLEFINSALK